MNVFHFEHVMFIIIETAVLVGVVVSLRLLRRSETELRQLNLKLADLDKRAAGGRP